MWWTNDFICGTMFETTDPWIYGVRTENLKTFCLLPFVAFLGLLCILPLSTLYKSRLYTAGYRTLADLNDVDVDTVARETGLSLEVCQGILTEVHRHDPSRSAESGGRLQTATSLHQTEQCTPAIVTFSEQIDRSLGGGVRVGQLTEICGLPGSGKTQLCLQLACDVQIPAVFGGLDGEVVYIDPERTLIINRLKDIAKATVCHCCHIASMQEEEAFTTIGNNLTEDALLSRIHYYSCHDYKHLLATIQQLPEFLRQHENVRLVLIDSIACHLRHSFDDMSLRTRIVTNLAQNLVKIAKTHQVAVVVTNQMTTRVGERTSTVIPALGESWGHACGTRLLLQWEGNQRVARLHKSPTQPQQTVPFQITSAGLRDAVFSDCPTESGDYSDHPTKRRKLIS